MGHHSYSSYQYSPQGHAIGVPDEYMGDDISEDILSNDLGGSFSMSELGHGGMYGGGMYGGMHGGMYGGMHGGMYGGSGMYGNRMLAGRSMTDQWFPDRTVMIVGICILGAVALLLVAALVALAVYSKKNANKYYVE